MTWCGVISVLTVPLAVAAAVAYLRWERRLEEEIERDKRLHEEIKRLRQDYEAE